MTNTTDRTAEAGIGILQTKIPKLLNYIFRPISLSDYGIDGEIEITDEAGKPTGRLVDAQVKSGPRYLKNSSSKQSFVFRGKKRHLKYWRAHSLPVILILVDVDAEIAYWTEVDDSAVTTGVQWKIEVPKSQILDASAKKPLADIANKLPDEVAAAAKRAYEAIRESHLEGRRRSALRELVTRVKQPTWRFVAHAVQAEAYRSLALWSYMEEQDLPRAEGYLLQARTADPASDETVVRALIKARDAGLDAALPLLEHATTATATNLRGLFLAATGKVAEAQAVLDTWPDGVARTPETTRVEALVALGMKDLATAHERISAALSEKPRWAGIRETYGLIEYASSLPTSEIPEPGAQIPMPIPPQLLRHDDVSLAHVCRAASTFQELAAEAEDDDDRARYEVWQLAALANDPSAGAAARALAESIAAREKLIPIAASWILQRGLIADPDPFQGRVIERAQAMDLDSVREDAGFVFLAIQRLLALDRHGEADELLKRFEGPLCEVDVDAHHFWRAQVSNAAGDPALARSETDLITRSDMRETAVNALATVVPDDWRGPADRLLQIYRTNGDVAALLNFTRAHAAHHDWEIVLSHADELFTLLPNLGVLQMICEAAYQRGEFRRCFEFLRRWEDLSTTRTEGLEQMRVACLLHVDPLAAANAARQLVRVHPSSTNSVTAMTAYLRIGDLKACSLEARRLLDDPAVESATLLNAVHVTAPEDRRLAVALFKKALKAGIDDEYVGAAVSAAHQLGLDHETATLAPRMQKLAAEGRGGITAMSLPELLKFGEERQTQIAEIATKFQAGELPIHLAARTLGWTLAEVFYVWADDNQKEPSPLRHRPLLVRTGALGPARVEALAERPLVMDTTAFLLAGDLGVLDAVERTYAPIRVSRFLPAVIFEQQRRLGDVQPSRLEMFERVVGLVEGKKVHVEDDVPDAPTATRDRGVDAFLHVAVEDAMYVEQLPLTDGDFKPRELPPEVAARVLNLGNYIAAAERLAVVTDVAARHAAVGVPLTAVEINELPEKVFLSYLATSALASSDALAQLAGAAEVHVSADLVQEARATLTWAARRRSLVGRLDELRDRLRVGLEKGTYVTIGEEAVDIGDIRDLDSEALRDVLRDAESSSNAVWVEDRFCSRMGAASVIDVLAHLRTRGELSDAAHAALTHRLRRSDTRYLPVDRDDIAHFLSLTRSRKLPDTQELLAISRYVASTALDGNRGNGVDRPAEIAALVETARALGLAAAEIWKLHLDDRDRARDHATWFMTHVYFGRAALRAATNTDAPLNEAMADTAADLAQLYMGAVILALRELPKEWATSATAEYVWWLSSTLALRKFFTNPDLLDATAQAMATLARSFTEREELSGIDSLIRGVFECLPEELQHAWLRIDAEFWKTLGVEVRDRLQVSGEDVPTDAFWESLECALAGAYPPNNPVRVRHDREKNLFDVEHEGRTLSINAPLFVRFAQGGDQAVVWAIDHSDAFDMPSKKREDEARRIVSLPTARERVIAADELRAEGGAIFYASFREQLCGGGSLPEGAFHLGIAALRDHLRWNDHREQAAIELVAEVGLEEALRRLVTLPFAMPRAVLDALAVAEDRRNVLSRLASSVAAPLSNMHIAALALRYGEEDAELLTLGQSIVEKLFSDEYERDGFGAFRRAALVVNAWLSFDKAGETTSSDERLVLSTSHASRLLDTLGEPSLPKAHEFFTRVTAAAREMLSRDPEYFDHGLYPTNLDYGRFVIGGIATLVDGLSEAARDVVGPMIERALKRLHEVKTIGGFLVDETLLHGLSPTILGGPVGAKIGAVTPKTPFQIPTPEELHRTTAELLDAGANSSTTIEWCTAIATIVSQHQLTEKNRTRVRALLEELKNEETRRPMGDREIVYTLTALVGQTVGDDDLRRLFTEVLLAVAREFDGSRRDQELLEELAPAFVEIAFTLAARPGKPFESAAELARLIDELVRVWPKLALAAAARLSSVVWPAPVEQSIPLWRVLLRSRESST